MTFSTRPAASRQYRSRIVPCADDGSCRFGDMAAALQPGTTVRPAPRSARFTPPRPADLPTEALMTATADSAASQLAAASPTRAWHAELAWLPGMGVLPDVLIEAAGD